MQDYTIGGPDRLDRAARPGSASVECPEDAFIAAGTECRAATGACDLAEACDGASVECPADAFVE